MKCKCGQLVRITVSSESYCWKCYDESVQATDASIATAIAHSQTFSLKDLQEAYRKFFTGGGANKIRY